MFFRQCTLGACCRAAACIARGLTQSTRGVATLVDLQMNQVATVAIGAAQLASNLGGVPALGVAASAAAGIQAACQKVVVHKVNRPLVLSYAYGRCTSNMRRNDARHCPIRLLSYCIPLRLRQVP